MNLKRTFQLKSRDLFPIGKKKGLRTLGLNRKLFERSTVHFQHKKRFYGLKMKQEKISPT